MTIDPFDLREPKHYDLVIDRLTHWYNTRREWIKKAIMMDDVYVFNNPWSVQSMEKSTIVLRHDAPRFPDSGDLAGPTPVVRTHGRSGGHAPELRASLRSGSHRQGARLPDVHEAVRRRRLARRDSPGGRVERSGRRTTRAASWSCILQKAVHPFDRFVRCIGLGPQTHVVLYDPKAPLHDRYTMEHDFLTDEERDLIDSTTLIINAFFALGLQLVRAAPQGRHLVPHRLREPLPRLAGHLPALPLSLAHQGQHPVVDLRRCHAAAAAPPGVDPVLHSRRGGDDPAGTHRRPLAHGARTLRDGAPSRSSAPRTFPTSTKSPTSGSAPRTPRDAVRQQGRGALPAP